jgi:hypothetical protein
MSVFLGLEERLARSPLFDNAKMPGIVELKNRNDGKSLFPK